MDASIICPNAKCGHQATVPRTMLGRELVCPICDRKFLSSESSDNTGSKPKPAAARTVTTTTGSQIGRFAI